jgi:adenylyltransferase/sulfurtransferase
LGFTNEVNSLPTRNFQTGQFERVGRIAGCASGTMVALQAVEALKFLTGIGSTLKNELLFSDGIHMKFEAMELQKNPDCQVCGR